MSNRFSKRNSITLFIVNILACTLIIILLEIILRLFFTQFAPARQERGTFWQFDSLLGWSQIPNVKAKFNHPEFSVDVRINSKGLRDDEYSYVRSDKNRALILGDSFAWGFGVDEKHRFSELLDSKLPNWEIINAGISGYSTVQQLLYFQNEGYKYEPDMVILLLFENDLVENTLETIYWHNKPYAVLEKEKVVIENLPVLMQSVYQKFRAFLKANFYTTTFLFNAINSIIGVPSKYPSDADEKNYAITEGLLKIIKEECEENNSEFLLVSIPLPEDKNNRLANFCKEQDIYYLSLSKTFENKSNYLIKSDGHWNAYGHKIVSEAIHDYKKSNLTSDEN